MCNISFLCDFVQIYFLECYISNGFAKQTKTNSRSFVSSALYTKQHFQEIGVVFVVCQDYQTNCQAKSEQVIKIESLCHIFCNT
jgi:hypothetical protein